MRCDEIQERLVEVLYDDSGSPNNHDELQAHLRTCSACRKELAELKQTRDYMRRWRDESPLRSVAVPVRAAPAIASFRWRYLRYAAVAAMALIALLALANAQVTWNKDGFSFATRLFAGQETEKNYYTKDETRDLLKQALDDSESRMGEINYLMVQKMLDTIEQERWMDLRLVRGSAAQNRNKN
jgi:anti-sigma factor RsiW